MEFESFFKKSLKNLANFFETFGTFLNVFSASEKNLIYILRKT